MPTVSTTVFLTDDHGNRLLDDHGNFIISGVSVSSWAVYRFLEDHSIGPFYLTAGDIASTIPTFPVPGGTVVVNPILPVNWIPSPNVEPLEAVAAGIFYSLGPADLGLIRQQWSQTAIVPPVTRWSQTGPNVWVLTGLGSGFAPVSPSVPVFHPVGNIPQ